MGRLLESKGVVGDPMVGCSPRTRWWGGSSSVARAPQFPPVGALGLRAFHSPLLCGPSDSTPCQKKVVITGKPTKKENDRAPPWDGTYLTGSSWEISFMEDLVSKRFPGTGISFEIHLSDGSPHGALTVILRPSRPGSFPFKPLVPAHVTDLYGGNLSTA